MSQYVREICPSCNGGGYDRRHDRYMTATAGFGSISCSVCHGAGFFDRYKPDPDFGYAQQMCGVSGSVGIDFAVGSDRTAYSIKSPTTESEKIKLAALKEQHKTPIKGMATLGAMGYFLYKAATRKKVIHSPPLDKQKA